MSKKRNSITFDVVREIALELPDVEESVGTTSLFGT
jgi:hypothetical protein